MPRQNAVRSRVVVAPVAHAVQPAGLGMPDTASDSHARSTPASAESREQLGLWDAVSLIVGVVVGAGIYETAPLVLANVRNAEMALLFWLAGGVLSLAGAACYAELASAYPRSGGDYFYLTRAFGPLAGFFFGWSQLAVILTGSIGMMAYVFADYAVGLGAEKPALLAVLAVVVLTALNVVSVESGKRTQNLLTLLKVAGVSAVVLAGFVSAASSARAPTLAPVVPSQPGAAGGGALGLAMILILYTYGGWNDAAFVAAEVRNKRKNVARALLIGTALVTLVYLLMNAAFLAALGFEQARASRAIAADLFEHVLGAPGRTAISVLVMISALGAASALIFTGARVVSSLGQDYRGLAALGRWPQRFGSPVWALLAQGAIAATLIGLVGTGAGRAVLVGAFGWLGLTHASFSGHGGFDTLLRCTAPVFWFFFLLTGISLFVLRFRDRELDRPFKVPLFPVVPLIFVGTCAFMLKSSVDYAGPLAFVTLPFLLAGIPFYFTRRQRGAPVLPHGLAPRAQPVRTPP
jgi:amino acid transporter